MPSMTRFWRIARWGTFSLAALIGSGLLLANHFTPPANGDKSHAISFDSRTDIAILLVEIAGQASQTRMAGML